MSHVMCHMSHVMCHMPQTFMIFYFNFLFHLFIFCSKWWSLSVEGLLSTKPSCCSLVNFWHFRSLWSFLTIFWFLVFFMGSWIFFLFFGVGFFWIFFCIYFLDFFFWLFLTFLDFWIFRTFLKFLGFLGDFFGILFKVTMFITKSYQGHYWTPKIAENGPKHHNKHFFCPKGKKSLGWRPKPSAGARSRPA